MKNKEILDEVYRRLLTEREKYKSQVQGWLFGDPLISFIETEWQREDEIEAKLNKIERKERGKKNEKDDHPLTKWDEGQQYFMDASEMELHRGLEIGEDGTVKSLKDY